MTTDQTLKNLFNKYARKIRLERGDEIMSIESIREVLANCALPPQERWLPEIEQILSY